MSLERIIECVPNFSEGRDEKKIDSIARAIRSIPGLSLLGIDPGADTNRTVYTFAGTPEAVLSGALAGARAAWDCIDMASQRGAHPRIGALDVCPFVPVSGVTMEECAAIAVRFGERLADELGVPVYLYEKSAQKPGRVSLADIRSGEYEGLAAKLAAPEWAPDFGPASFMPRWGATVTGAREFLVAININLNTRDKQAAQDIARSVRESGRLERNPDGTPALDTQGKPIRLPGRLKSVRAIGWYIEEYRCAQVSVNLLDYRVTGLSDVYETIKDEAEKRGLFVTGSELVGLVPLEAIRACGRHFASRMTRSPGLPDTELAEIAAQTLGLGSVSDFSAPARIIEWAYRGTPFLVSKTVTAFADEVSTDTPAPGGGSVAALAGALGASLVAMVGNLGAPRGADSRRPAVLGNLAMKAQGLKTELLGLVDEDTKAFDAVLAAARLPKVTEVEIRTRSAALDVAYKEASRVPLAAAGVCLEVLRLCRQVVELGRKSSATDGAVGALVARAGLEGAILNVQVNLPSISDEAFTKACLAEASKIATEASKIGDEIKDLIAAILIV